MPALGAETWLDKQKCSLGSPDDPSSRVQSQNPHGKDEGSGAHLNLQPQQYCKVGGRDEKLSYTAEEQQKQQERSCLQDKMEKSSGCQMLCSDFHMCTVACIHTKSILY